MEELEVKCPHCGGMGIVKREEDYFYFQCTACGKRQQKERVFFRYFGFPLYYQTSFDDKIIWAYNREHLVFLINYVETGMREHVYNMPKFITLAKNRNQIVKLLKRLLYNE